MLTEIIKTDPRSKEARVLIEELSKSLFRMTGDSGTSSFNDSDLDSPKAEFIVLRINGESVACGAIRPITDEICEIKRMFSKRSGQGFGKQVLSELEKLAAEFGYKEIWLSTRKINQNAVTFYLNNEYSVHESYGKYKYTNQSVCLSKKIS